MTHESQDRTEVSPRDEDKQSDHRIDASEQGRNEEKLIYEWVAPSRPYKKRDREYFTTIAIIVILVSLILFFAGQFLFIAVVISLAFVSYVLAAIPPESIHNAITTFGIRTGDQLFYWEELGRFWFSEKYKSEIMHVETSRAFPGQLILLLDSADKEVLKKIMLKHTVFQKPTPTWLDKASTWMQDRFPLEHDSLDKKS